MRKHRHAEKTCFDSFGSTQYWTPVDVVGRKSGELSWLQNRVKVATKWAMLFDGSQYQVSDRFHHSLSQFGLHNMRSSDEATDMFSTSFEALWSRLMTTPDECSGGMQGDVLKLSTSHSRNIKMPNFACWMTTYLSYAGFAPG